MTTANKITLTRIFLIPVMIILFYALGIWGGLAAAVTFLIASLGDILDGYVARTKHQVSDFGKIFDPLADKMLAAAAMIILLDGGAFAPVWGAVGIAVILVREFTMGMVRQVSAIRGVVVAADGLGKLKTLCLTVSILMLFISIPGTESYVEGIWYAGQILFLVSAAIAVVSLSVYFIKNRQALKNLSGLKAVPRLNAGTSVAHPDPNTVFAVSEKYPQRPEPRPRPQQESTQPPVHGNINLVNTISEGKLTKDIFDSIVLYVIATQTVSLNKIQEKFQIGYRLASDAIDKMEEFNYITKLTPTSKRRVLITRDQYLNQKRQDF